MINDIYKIKIKTLSQKPTSGVKGITVNIQQHPSHRKLLQLVLESIQNQPR
jgi:hypothetical protein